MIKKGEIEWREVELGNEKYFNILSSGINKFQNEKDYLSTESVQGTQIEKVECKIKYEERPSRANMQPVFNSVWFAKMKSTIKVYSFSKKNKEEINKYILSTGFAGIKFNEDVSSDYVKFFLLTERFNKEKDKLSTGSTQSGINNSFTSKIKIPIPFRNGSPDLEEQERIVKILEKSERLKEQSKKANELLDEYLKSVFYEMFLKEEFAMGTIRDLLTEAKYGSSKKSNEQSKGYEMLRMNNITYDGGWDLRDLKYIELRENEKEKYLVRKGDILFNRTNSKELVGKTATYNFDKSRAYAGYLVRLRVNNKATPEYVSGFLNSKRGKFILLNMCKSIVGMANINAQEVQEIKIPLPPLSLQQKFASIVKHVERMKENVKKTQANTHELFNSLMQKAFMGELTQ
jgi:type I restriction enzyme S subunit